MAYHTSSHVLPRSVETRITQEALRRHVLRVLRTWRERYMFSDDYLNGLQVGTGLVWAYGGT